jgi:hypothetical protein
MDRAPEAQLPRLSREVRDALDHAVSEHRSAVLALRLSVCAYYDALVINGVGRVAIVELITGLVTDVTPPAAASPMSAAQCHERVVQMLAWCDEPRA